MYWFFLPALVWTVKGFVFFHGGVPCIYESRIVPYFLVGELMAFFRGRRWCCFFVVAFPLFGRRLGFRGRGIEGRGDVVVGDDGTRGHGRGTSVKRIFQE